MRPHLKGFGLEMGKILIRPYFKGFGLGTSKVLIRANWGRGIGGKWPSG